MAKSIYKVTIGDKTKVFEEGTPYGEVITRFGLPDADQVLLVLVNGILCEMHKAVREDCAIECITFADEIGRNAYNRSLNFLFLKAAADVLDDPAAQTVLNFSNGNCYYYTLEGGRDVTGELVGSIRDRMNELVEEDLPIQKEKMKTSEAQKLFAERNMKDKTELFRYRRSSQVNVYTIEDYKDYFFGYTVWRTGYLKHFDLCRYENGIMLQLPEADGITVRPLSVFPKIFNIQCLSSKWDARQGINTEADLNRAIVDGTFGQQMLVTEALQEGRISYIADEIRERGNVKFVMIAGPSSSGKTTFSRRLSIQLRAKGLIPHPLSLDDFYRDRSECPRDENGELDFECLEALDVDLIRSTLKRLQEGERVELPRFNFRAGAPEYRGDFLQLGDEDIMVIEGIHGLNPVLAETLPAESVFRIYISALTTLNVDNHNYISTTDARLLRRIVRDYYTRGSSACETIERWPSVRAGEQKNIFTNQENADEMFNSALLYELSILKVYAEPLLYQVPEDRPEYLKAKQLLKFLDYFLGYPSEAVPNNSILREFIGGSCFDV